MSSFLLRPSRPDCYLAAVIVFHIAAIVLAALTVAGIVYQLAAARLVWRFARAIPPMPVERPAISLLKPLHGDEPGLADNLRALCEQAYPRFQIVCGTLDAADAALPLASLVRNQFPAAEMEIVAGAPDNAARNRKIANLESLLARAKHPIVAFADSDIAARPGHLDDLAAALAMPGIGIATCLYVARPEPDRWSRLEASWVNHAFLPSALVARAVGRKDGCFGATMALRREVLDRIGGLAPLRDILADDWALGAAVRRLGLGIGLAARPVDMVVHHADFGAMFAHELRWARTIAALDRKGYLASIVTQPVILGLLAALAGGLTMPTIAILALAVAARLVTIRIEERALKLPRAPLPLLGLREFLTFAVFATASLGRTVTWRGLRYRIEPDGTMHKLEDLSR
jgi:ceramide glucosyltransferase